MSNAQCTIETQEPEEAKTKKVPEPDEAKIGSMKSLAVTLVLFAGMLSAQTLTPFCISVVSTNPIKVIPCPTTGAVWGSITGTITNQTDLVAALAAAGQV
jgi:hypothetical protein